MVSNLRKTTMLLAIGSAISVTIAFSIQNKANQSVSACSYLDPITIDIVALIMGAFLVIEGVWDILHHATAYLKSQITRCIRVWLGVCILTIHIMQFLHK